MQFGKEYFDFCLNKDRFDMRAKGDWQKKYVEFISRVFPIIENTGIKALDFGCALGSTTSAFNDAKIDMDGIDVSPWYGENSPFENMKGKIFSYTPETINGRASVTFGFKSRSFDFIHSQQVIEHIPEDMIPATLRELNRICKKGAIVYLATIGHSDEPLEKRSDPTHITCHGPDFWIPLFKAAGFQVLTEDYKPLFENEPFYKQYNWVQYILKK